MGSLVGQQLNHYRVVEKIGEGGMGAVYVGSESHPYAVKPSGTVVAEAVGATPEVHCADFEFACKAGSEAMFVAQALVKAGQVTYAVGIGGDTIHGIDFVDCLKRFKDDPETESVVLIGEIGGREEENAAAYLRSVDYGKPVIGLVVGRNAPTGRRMGHAGTLSVFGMDKAEAKISALKGAGVRIAGDASKVVETVLDALR